MRAGGGGGGRSVNIFILWVVVVSVFCILSYSLSIPVFSIPFYSLFFVL